MHLQKDHDIALISATSKEGNYFVFLPQELQEAERIC